MKNVAAEQLEPLAREATRLLKAMAHPARLMICCQLRDGEMSVGRMESTLGIRQPNLSRELARLRDEGILTTRRESRVVFYRLQHARMRALIDAVCSVMLGDGAPAAEAGTPASGPAARHGAAAMSTAPDLHRPATAAEAAAAPGTTGAAGAIHDDVMHRAGAYGVFARTGTSDREEER